MGGCLACDPACDVERALFPALEGPSPGLDAIPPRMVLDKAGSGRTFVMVVFAVVVPISAADLGVLRRGRCEIEPPDSLLPSTFHATLGLLVGGQG